MDSLKYNYYAGNNRLEYVNDAVSASSFTNDIDNQGGGNYKYDKTGNLVEDVSESIRIHWTYYNKVKQIDSVKLTPPKYGLVWATKLRMKYDALGNRVVKENPKHKVKEVYVRDTQGNILALYQVKNDSLYTKEFYMYGSQRLGYLEDDVFLGKKCIGKFCNIVANPVNPMPFIGTQKTLPTLPPVVIQPISSSSVGIVFGKKRYELSDWLGNVRVVINDRKTPVNSGVTTVGYKAQVINVNDYYSFGSEINERTYTYNTLYRFSFNGKEDIRDQRWYQDYGARWYNKVLGRFISADPIIITEKKYPWYSSYQFAGNKPINSIDLDGKEDLISITTVYENGSKSIMNVFRGDQNFESVQKHIGEQLGIKMPENGAMSIMNDASGRIKGAYYTPGVEITHYRSWESGIRDWLDKTMPKKNYAGREGMVEALKDYSEVAGMIGLSLFVGGYVATMAEVGYGVSIGAEEMLIGSEVMGITSDVAEIGNEWGKGSSGNVIGKAFDKLLFLGVNVLFNRKINNSKVLSDDDKKLLVPIGEGYLRTAEEMYGEYKTRV